MSRSSTTAKNNVYAFVDTNIYLDFYRNSTEATLKLLQRLVPVRDRIISTYLVEMEFLKNRQRVIGELLAQMKAPGPFRIPAVLGADEAILTRGTEPSPAELDFMRNQVGHILSWPQRHDIVYRTTKAVFHSTAAHVLTRDMEVRHEIKRRAENRFLLGYPPRKRNDTSIGDAFNWEWIVECSKSLEGDIVVVSRDSDYGLSVKDEHYLNDQLHHEFKGIIGGKKRISYTTRLSEALQMLSVDVPAGEVTAESTAFFDSLPLSAGEFLSRWQTNGGDLDEGIRAYKSLMEQARLAERYDHEP